MEPQTSQKLIFSVLARNHPGVLLRMVGLFSRRGFNIESLVASTTQDPDYSRLSLVALGDRTIYKQIRSQLLKLEEVVRVEMLDAEDCSASELLLIKVRASEDNRNQLLVQVQAAGGRILDIGPSTLTIEMSGRSEVVDAFIQAMDTYGIVEMARSGISVLERGDKTIHDFVD